ncbi:hypothetical protein [Kutzneria sp. CA-103260]|uniref:hypothetical protein n=1 Tax=Kutzneria sp. CA-103260 TaxID=2802641 RepID=UPI001BA663EA|nr:hypothetical protein [Kutzneria sp. CA-103260]QUQ72268.1 hypothetical protein JJ691_100560 [Kutzneria sp. CA-103260]
MTWLVTGAAAVVALLFQYIVIGVPLVPWALLITLAIAALVFLGVRLLPPVDPSWQPLPASSSAPIATHASSLGARLADAETDPTRFASRVRPRLQALALGRIRRRPGCGDLGLDDPVARELLGADLHRLLTDRTATMPNPARFAELLTRLEEL